MELKGKSVIITGASRGIGRALAVRLAREETKCCLCGRDEAALKHTEQEARKAGARLVFTKIFDLADEAAIKCFYRESCKAAGVPDILINNAGFNSRKAFTWELTTGEFDSMMAVNLRAPFLLIREAFDDMKNRGSGRVVNILSTVCLFDMEKMPGYTAAKKGLQGLTDVFRKEARPHNIRVISVYPGGTDTDFREAERPHYMRPETVAEAVCAALTLPDDAVMHEMTFRPMAETNF